MKYTVLTLFPEIIDAYFSNSIMAKAVERGIVNYRAINIRDYAFDKHKTCDDAPYGGGPGMLMLPEPLSKALEAAGVSKRSDRGAITNTKKRVIYLSPSGSPLNQEKAKELTTQDELVLICGRYEGIDQRVIDL